MTDTINNVEVTTTISPANIACEEQRPTVTSWPVWDGHWCEECDGLQQCVCRRPANRWWHDNDEINDREREDCGIDY